MVVFAFPACEGRAVRLHGTKRSVPAAAPGDARPSARCLGSRIALAPEDSMKAKARSMVLGCAVLAIMSLRCAPEDDAITQSGPPQAATVAFTTTTENKHDSRC